MSNMLLSHLNIAIAQINPTVGAIENNSALILKSAIEANRKGAHFCIFPELVLCGYPPEDLILKPKFLADCMSAAVALAQQLPIEMACIVGAPYVVNEKIYNCALVMIDGKILHIIPKTKLPNSGVFDEIRTFHSALEIPAPVDILGVKCGIPICEDIWTADVCAAHAKMGAQIFLVPNSSPFWKGKNQQRMQIAQNRVRETGLPMIYTNQVGGQDELVFDGASFVLNETGECVAHLPMFHECVVCLPSFSFEGRKWRVASDQGVINTSRLPALKVAPSPVKGEENIESLYMACVVGLRDYVNKNGFKSVVLGLSGGIDSALCAAIAVDALGKDKVFAVMMPYKYTGQESLEDASQCAKNLGISYDIIPIAPAIDAINTILAPQFNNTQKGITEENLQSRIRGTLLMALSNKFGHMVVTTGNKSEMAVGYCTLYGDMNGGFNPIKDLYKTEVFKLSVWRNSISITFPFDREHNTLGANEDELFSIPFIRQFISKSQFKEEVSAVIPPRILTKPPSAELRQDQTDQDSLPPYDILDAILQAFVEHEQSVVDIIAMGFDEKMVRNVEKLLFRAEYKRRQAAPGVKLSTRNFDRDRRYPITNGYLSG